MGQNEKDGVDRRGALECMLWAGTGVLWTLVGGVPRSSSLLGVSEANAQVASGFRRSVAGNAPAIARGFYRGEALKIGVTVLLFVLALRGRRLAAGPLFAGYVATFVAYWVALWRSAGAHSA